VWQNNATDSKSTKVTRYVKLARYVKLSVYEHDRAQGAQRIQVVSILLLHEAIPVLGLFCLHLNTIAELVELVMRKSVVLKKEAWECRSHTKQNGRLYQAVRIK